MRRAVVAALLALGCHPQPGPEPPISPRAPKAAPATETLRDAEPTPREGLRLILDLANDLRVDQVQNAALVALPPSVGTHNAPLLLAPGGARVAHELVAAESVEGFVGGHFPTALVAVVSNREDYAVARFERGHWIPLQAESDPYAPSRERPDGYAPATSKLSNCPARLAHLHEVLQLSNGSRVEIGDDCESDLYQEILGGAKLCNIVLHGRRELAG
ncbi:MAG: hypothetical protein H6718_07120 [Polyangiaceae bacterium]|nr:hypothetical protein [Myxococcales bacterium]MCB9585151.1 hypothetical protein [Polyangiaceae bacterium]